MIDWDSFKKVYILYYDFDKPKCFQVKYRFGAEGVQEYHYRTHYFAQLKAKSLAKKYSCHIEDWSLKSEAHTNRFNNDSEYRINHLKKHGMTEEEAIELADLWVGR